MYFDPQLKTTLYPDCHDYPSCGEKVNQTAANASFPNLVYIRAAAGNDILHFVITTIHLPSILAVHTVGDTDAQLNFDWDRLLMAENSTDIAGAINVTDSKDIQYSFALVFSRVGVKSCFFLHGILA